MTPLNRFKHRVKLWLQWLGYKLVYWSYPPYRTPYRLPIQLVTGKKVIPAIIPDLDVRVADTLQETYDQQYESTISEWRKIGAVGKAANIQNLCQRNNLNPYSVLEVGAGDGNVLAEIARLGIGSAHYAAEISKSGVLKIQEQNIPTLIEVFLFNGYQLPFADQSFDLVILSHVLEHVEHPRLLLREIVRVSQFQILEIPLDDVPGVDQRSEALTSYGHIDVYTPARFRFLLHTEFITLIDDLLNISSEAVVLFGNANNAQKSLAYRKRLKRFQNVTEWERERLSESYTVLTSKHL